MTRMLWDTWGSTRSPTRRCAPERPRRLTRCRAVSFAKTLPQGSRPVGDFWPQGPWVSRLLCGRAAGSQTEGAAWCVLGTQYRGVSDLVRLIFLICLIALIRPVYHAGLA